MACSIVSLFASFEGPQLSTASSPSGSPLFVLSIAGCVMSMADSNFVQLQRHHGSGSGERVLGPGAQRDHPEQMHRRRTNYDVLQQRSNNDLTKMRCAC